MHFARRLILNLLAVLLVPLLVGCYVAARFFLFTDAQRITFALAATASGVALGASTAWLVWWLARPIERAFGAGEDAAGPLRERAVSAALRLPGQLAVALLLFSSVFVGVVVLALRQDLAPDLAVAGAGSGAAFAIMGAMLGYSTALDAVALVLVELGSMEVRHRGGTMRGKVLAVCYGLLAAAALLLLPASYVRYRGDVARRYVEVAASAQERGARWIAASRVADAAELVYAASGARTKIVDAAGRTVARAPDAAAMPLLDRAPPGSGIEEVPGGWLVRRAAGPFTMVSFLPDEPLRAQRQAFWSRAPGLGLLLLAACALLVVWHAARTLTLPIRLLGEAADRIASGDLTASPPWISEDEIGKLAVDFRKMAHDLAALVNDVQAASRGVQDGTREMNEIGERVRGGARTARDRIVAAHATVEAMQGSTQLVARGVEGLSADVRVTGVALGEMAVAIEEVRRQAAELESRMGSTGANVQRLSDAGGRADTQLGSLGTLVGSAQATLASVTASLAGLETSAVASQLAAAQAAEMAEQAGGVVQDTVGGIESLRSAVDEAKRRVAVLWHRSDDIDKILDFIGEVAGRTNLLSLNASIIATQAGEHGKAFGVVAEQIRDLAAQISSSTKSIGQIIRAVRDDVNGTARLIDRGDALAADGVAHARKSLGALQEIRAATAKGHETAAAIRDAVQAHAMSTRDVSNLVLSAAETSRALSEAIQMVGTSIRAVGSASGDVRAFADKVGRALDEQAGKGRRQLESLGLIDAVLADITRAVENHQEATARLREVLMQLTRAMGQHEAAAVDLSGVADRLGTRSRSLAERVGKYKV